MKHKLIIVLIVLFVSAVGTPTTFTHRSYMQRQIIDPAYPPYLSDAVETRGWPWAFIADDPSHRNFRSIGPEDWLLLGGLLFDFGFFVGMFSVLAVAGWAFKRRLLCE